MHKNDSNDYRSFPMVWYFTSSTQLSTHNTSNINDKVKIACKSTPVWECKDIG